ncbi:MAG: hypothetical protein WD766_01440 [Gemmatimonadota bacterium]
MTHPPPPPTRNVAFVSHYDCARHDTGWSHPDHQGRLPAVMRAVYGDMLTLVDHLEEIEGRHATDEELRLIHTAVYLDRVRGWAAEAAERGSPIEVRPGLVISDSSWDAARAAVGSALTAVDAVLERRVTRAFVAARPPGAGAAADEPGEFALLNTVAIAARYVRDRFQTGPVLVVELDGGSGSRLREVLGATEGVRVLRLTAAEPGKSDPDDGRSTRALPVGSDGQSAVAELRHLLDSDAREPVPALILLAAGFDMLDADPRGTLALEPLDFHVLTVALRTYADRVCAGRLVSVLEGGYAPAELGTAVVQHLRALADLPPSN